MKERKKCNYLYIVYVIVLLFASVSCSIGVNPVEIDEILEQEIVIVPEMDEIEIIIEEAIEPIEETIIMMKPIDLYDAYAVDDENKKIHGLKEDYRDVVVLRDEDDKIHQFKDFFIKDGTIFFTTDIYEDTETEIPNTDPVQYVKELVTHYYFQTGDVIAEDSESTFPDKPESEFKTMAEGNFKIVEIRGVSEVMRGTLRTAFYQIDGFFFTDKGLWFSVSETIIEGLGKRLKGVYFYGNSTNLRSSPQFIGRVWKK